MIFLAHFDLEGLYNEYNYNTLSGLILGVLEHIPTTGEKFQWQGFEFEIVDMDSARIDKVLATRINDQEEDRIKNTFNTDQFFNSYRFPFQ